MLKVTEDSRRKVVMDAFLVIVRDLKQRQLREVIEVKTMEGSKKKLLHTEKKEVEIN